MTSTISCLITYFAENLKFPRHHYCMSITCPWCHENVFKNVTITSDNLVMVAWWQRHDGIMMALLKMASLCFHNAIIMVSQRLHDVFIMPSLWFRNASMMVLLRFHYGFATPSLCLYYGFRNAFIMSSLWFYYAFMMPSLWFSQCLHNGFIMVL